MLAQGRARGELAPLKGGLWRSRMTYRPQPYGEVRQTLQATIALNSPNHPKLRRFFAKGHA
jgi:hypothetical protein